MEIWKDIKDYEGRYKVSSKGRVKSLGNDKGRKEKILKGGINTKGYRQVQLRRDKKSRYLLVSRLVCSTFLSNIENKRTVNHKDGNGRNNNLENLEWATYSENNKHAYKFLGRISSMHKAHLAVRKLSNKDVIEIRKKLISGFTIKQLSKSYSVALNCIWQIKHRKTYKNI